MICQSQSREGESFNRGSSSQGQAGGRDLIIWHERGELHTLSSALLSCGIAHEGRPSLPWQRLRHWFAPAQHALLVNLRQAMEALSL